MTSLLVPIVVNHRYADLDIPSLLKDTGLALAESSFETALSRNPVMLILITEDLEQVSAELKRLTELKIPCLIFCAKEVQAPGGLVRLVSSPWQRQTALSALCGLLLEASAGTQQLNMVVNSLEDIAFTLDHDLRHTAVFGGWLEKGGLSSEMFLGRTASQVLGESCGEIHEQAARQALQGESVVYEWSARGKGRKLTWYQTRVSPVYSPNRYIVGVIGIGRDVTQQRIVTDKLVKSVAQVERLNRDLDKAIQSANQSHRAKTEFLAAVSQEFRIHLNQLVGLGDLLTETTLNNEQRRYADMLKDPVASLIKLNDDIHHMSRLELGSKSLKIVEFSLSSTLDQVAAVLKPQLIQAGVSLIIKKDSDLPERIAGDVDCLSQILLNLVGDALSYQRAGEITLELSKVPASGVDDTLTLLCSVRSGGAPKLEASLGMVLAARTVELLGGNLWTETDRLGSLVKAALQFQLPASDSPGERVYVGHNQALSVLLVEDFLDNVTLVKAFLANTKHRLAVAENGQVGVDMYKKGKYDVILMDMQMPVMDGFSATREIRSWETEQGLKPSLIIALTAYAFPEDVARALKAGCNAHLAKPVTKSALLAAITNWIHIK